LQCKEVVVHEVRVSRGEAKELQDFFEQAGARYSRERDPQRARFYRLAANESRSV
jgi:hypothetical protein